MVQCNRGLDEERCTPTNGVENERFTDSPIQLYMGTFYQYYILKRQSRLGGNDQPCPSSHFQCPNSDPSVCLPIYLRCNGVTDCQGHEDEEDCEHYTCPGHYRCRDSKVCVHASNVCDKLYGQCPQNDDEWMCDVRCPHGCTCHGHEFFCSQAFAGENHPYLRFVSADGSNMTLEALCNNAMLIYLSVSRCFLSKLTLPFPNLHSLYLSDNVITSLSLAEFMYMNNLHVLVLARNPLDLQVSVSTITTLSRLEHLDLSSVHIPTLDPNQFQKLSQLRVLNLSSTRLTRVQNIGFHTMRSLEAVDLTHCPLTDFPHLLFRGLGQLREVRATNFKMCCPRLLPEDFDPVGCLAPSDQLSSCGDLLGSSLYRVGLLILAVFSVLGNSVSLLFRVVIDRSITSFGFGVFVMHLCLSDFLMGVYLMMIGGADLVYQGNYLMNDMYWKSSVVCKAAGFLSLVSSEVSAFLVSVITMDRFLVLRFPFSSVRFSPRSAHLCSLLLWGAGFCLGAVPLLPPTAHWNFYGQTGLCIPLPITSAAFSGHTYSFGVFICLNMALFLLIAAGQGFVYWSVRFNMMKDSGRDGGDSNTHVTIARRLLTVVLSDFVCWFPIGVAGLLAHRGVGVSQEVNVALAVLVLPLNAALNPFLYTANVIRERRRAHSEKRLIAALNRTLYEDDK